MVEPTITAKGKVSSDHKVTIAVPAEWPEGAEVEAVLRPVDTDDEHAGRNKRLVEFLRSLQEQPGRKSRSKEEIDRDIQEERDSWER